jgi:hypothetical protein
MYRVFSIKDYTDQAYLAYIVVDMVEVEVGLKLI